MTIKPIKLSAKKDGNGYISSYTFNIGIKEAKECGFINLSGEIMKIEKILDPENKQIIARAKNDEI